MKKNILRALILLSGFVIILFTGLFLCLDHPYVQKEIQERISAAIPGRISWEDISVSLPGGRLSLEGLRLIGADDTQIIYLQDLSVQADLPALLKKRLVFPRIRIKGPSGTLAVDSRGNLNLIAAVSPPQDKAAPSEQVESGPMLPLVIKQFELEEGTLDLKFQDRPAAVRMSGISIRVSNADLLGKKGDLTLKLDHTEIQNGSDTLSLGPVKLDAGLDGQDLAIRSLGLKSDVLDAVLQGRIQDPFRTPVFDLALSADARPEAAPEQIRAQVPVIGPLSARLILKGDLNGPEIQIAAGSDKLEIHGRTVQDLDLALNYKNRTLNLKTLTGSMSEAGFGLSGRLALGRGFPAGFSGWPETLRRLSNFFNGRALPEKLTAQLGLTLRVSDIKIKGLQNRPPLTLSAEAVLDKDSLVLSPLTGTAEKLNLTGSGRFTPAGSTLSGHLEMVAKDLEQILGIFDIPGSGSASLKANVSGTTAAPDLNLDLAGRTVSIDDIRLGDLDVRADMEPEGRILIRRLAVDNKSSRLRASGHLDLLDPALRPRPDPRLDLNLTLENLDPTDFMPGTSLHGKISGSGHISGSPEQPEADLRLIGRSLALPPYTVGDADAALRFSHGILSVDTFTLKSGNSRLTASGRVELETGGAGFAPHLDLTIKSSALLLQDFVDHAEGGLSLEAEVSGRPDTLTGKARLNGRNLIFAGQEIEALMLDSRFESGRIFVSDLTLRPGAGSAVTGQGWFDVGQKAFEFDLAADDFPLTTLPVLEEKGITSGRLSMAVSGSGTLDAPEVNGKIGITDAAYRGVTVPPVDLDIVSNGRTARVSGDAGFGITGAYTFGTKRFEAELNMERLPLSAYLTAAGLPELSGRISGKITARGLVNDPAGMEAKAALSDLHLAYNGNEVGSIPSLSAAVEKGQFHISETRLTVMDQGGLRISGSGTFGGDMRMSAGGRIPVAIVDPFVPELSEITGHILVSADLSGPTAAPLLTGDLTLEGIGALPAGTDHRLHDITGRIRLTPETVEIPKIEGYLDRGRFELSGRVGVKDFIPQNYALGFSGHHLFLEIQDMMDLKIDTELALEGDAAAPRLSGEIVLQEGRYYKNVGLDLLTADGKKRSSRTDGESAPDSKLKAVSLDIDINYRDPFVVDNNLAFLSISPDLRITGTAQVPVITGRARVDQGTLQFQMNEFEVGKGIIDFVNPYRTEATVAIQGQAEIRSWTIFLSVTGPPDNLDVTLTSSPSESHADILSLLVFGKTTRELRKGEGGALFSPEQILAGYVAGNLGDKLKSATGLDHVETRVEASDGDNPLGVGVTVGKDLSRQMTVKYGVDRRGGETVQRVTTDYKLLKNILMSGFQDTGGHYGGELKFRLEFR